MDFIKLFTIKNIKRNKKRTIVTIIGVMLSAALICTVAGMTASFIKSLQENAIKTEGNYHAIFYDVDNGVTNLIEDNVHVKKSGKVQKLGFAKLPGVETEYMPYVQIFSFDKGARDIISVSLSQGRMPERDDEIIVSKTVETVGGLRLTPGDKITLAVGDRMWNGVKLYSEMLITGKNVANVIGDNLDALENAGVEIEVNDDVTEAEIKINGEKIKPSGEELAVREEKTYTVVGVFDEVGNGVRINNMVSYGAITAQGSDFTEGVNKSDVYVQYDTPKNTETYNDEISAKLDEHTDDEKTYYYGGYSKSELARFSGSLSDMYIKTLWKIVSVIVVVIVLTSVFVISNSFRISVSEKVGQYGMLASVGATRRQIRRTVLYEGLYIGLFGTAGGVLLSVLVMKILVWLVNYLTGDVIGVKLYYALPWWVIVLTVIVSALTIYLSCALPARSAAKISPIEAIGGNREIRAKLTAKKLKTGKLFRRLFGIGGVIASKNLKRSRRKYRTTVISLVLGVAVFVGLSSFVKLGYGFVNMEYQNISYDLSVVMGYPDTDAWSEDARARAREAYAKVDALSSVNELHAYKEVLLTVDMKKYASKEFEDYYCAVYHGNPEDVSDTEESDWTNYISVIVMNPKDFADYARKAGIKNPDVSSNVFLSDQCLAYTDDVRHLVNVTRLNEGDTVSGMVEEYSSDGTSETEESFRITKRTDLRPMGYEDIMSDSAYIFVSEEYFDQMPTYTMSNAFLLSDQPSVAAAEISELANTDPDVRNCYVLNIAKEADQMRRMLLAVSIFLYGFVIVIILIGVTNVINTITTNMNLRAREFAMLRSIGMTEREFHRMIRLESLMYGSKSLAIGVPLGVVISYGLNRAFRSSYVVDYSLPWQAILIAAVFVGVIVGFTMRFSLGKINKQNMIETIRKQTL